MQKSKKSKNAEIFQSQLKNRRKSRQKKSKEIRRKFFNVPNKNQAVLNKKHGAATRMKTLFISGSDALFISKSILRAFRSPSFHIQKTTRYITGNIEKPKLDVPLLTLNNP